MVVQGCKVQKEELPHPNIIMFLVDDMGWQDCSVPFWTRKTAFNKRYHTPNIERLASQGMKFTQAYACAICSPTRVSLMSGMNAARHRVTNWTLRRSENSVPEPEELHIPKWNLNGAQPVDSIERSIYITPLAQILKDNGYFTIHSGKAHFGAIGTPGANPLNMGFDINIAGHAAGAPGSYQGLNNFGNNPDGTAKNVWSVPGLEKYYGQDINLSDALTKEAIIALDSSLKTKKPFFLYMAHYAVHIPIQADNRFIDEYNREIDDKIEAKYASMVAGMDKSLGNLMNYLEKKGIADNTIILFMSDNGGLSAVARGGKAHTHNKPLSSGKGSAHEGGIREPMIVKWPGVVKQASVNNNYLIIEDFFPSILEMANIQDYKTVQHVDGKSFVPVLRGKNKSSRERALFWHYPNNWGPIGPGIGASSTVRRGNWKLIYYHANRSFELFNLKQDIGETSNRAKTSPRKLAEMAKILSDYLRSVNAQMPIDKKTGKVVEWPDEVL